MGIHWSSFFIKNFSRGIFLCPAAKRIKISAHDWWLLMAMYQAPVLRCSGILNSHLRPCSKLRAPVIIATILLPVLFEMAPRNFFNDLLGMIRGMLMRVRNKTPIDRINTMEMKARMPIKDFLILFIVFNFRPYFF